VELYEKAGESEDKMNRIKYFERMTHVEYYSVYEMVSKTDCDHHNQARSTGDGLINEDCCEGYFHFSHLVVPCHHGIRG
jgi:hypothetical protein